MREAKNDSCLLIEIAFACRFSVSMQCCSFHSNSKEQFACKKTCSLRIFPGTFIITLKYKISFVFLLRSSSLCRWMTRRRQQLDDDNNKNTNEKSLLSDDDEARMNTGTQHHHKNNIFLCILWWWYFYFLFFFTNLKNIINITEHSIKRNSSSVACGVSRRQSGFVSINNNNKKILFKKKKKEKKK